MQTTVSRSTGAGKAAGKSRRGTSDDRRRWGVGTSDRRWGLLSAGSVLVAAGLACTALAAPGPASAAAPATRQSLPAATPGTWTELGPAPGQLESGTPAVWMNTAGTATILWDQQINASAYTYDASVVSPTGAAGSTASIFGTSYWGSLSSEPTIVSQGSSPLVVFSGGRSNSAKDPYSRGCIVGDLSNGSGWSLQPWSLSANCVNPIGTATETGSGVLSAAWPGGWSNGHGVLYRIGSSPNIPASGADSHIALAGPADADKTGEASDVAGNGDVYVAWAQGGSSAASDDGFYVEDVTAHGALHKAPGSGTTSINHLGGFSNLAIANTNTHAGIWIAYCSNTSTCSLELWHVGATSALAVPHSASAEDVAVSAGPDGRLWLAWYDGANSTVSTVRTNEADTAFGAVETYKTPCFEDGDVGTSGGSFGRLDVALQCINNNSDLAEYVAQSLPALSFTPSKPTIKNASANNVTFKVTDVGDAVAGAKITVAGKAAATNGAGSATISFPKGMKTGSYAITVSAADYYSAHGSLVVKG